MCAIIDKRQERKQNIITARNVQHMYSSIAKYIVYVYVIHFCILYMQTISILITQAA